MANQSDRTGNNFNSNTARSTTISNPSSTVTTGKNKTNPNYKGDQHKGTDKGDKRGGSC